MPAKCATCPFREEGYKEVRSLLEMRVLENRDGLGGSPICHSTGPAAIIEKPIRQDEWLCRGARDFALHIFAGLGFLEAPTDAAWDKKVAELGL